MNHRYILQPYKTPASRYTCPQCGHAKRFKRYVDTQTNAHLAPHVGMCDRVSQCGYHYPPRKYFADNPSQKPAMSQQIKPIPPKPHSTIPMQLVEQTLGYYNQNYFTQFLRDMVGRDIYNDLIADYRIGTSKHWHGATIFWQIDIKGKARTGKIMLYNPQDCRRVKHPYNHIAWAHNVIRNAEGVMRNDNKADNKNSAIGTPHSAFNLKQCLFGEHLLPKYPNAPVALVESEKTAIIGAAFMPQYLWLAAGSLQGLTVEKCRVLKGRDVMLFPDLDGYQQWYAKASQLSAKLPTVNFSISNFLRKNTFAEDACPGMDIADFYIADWFRCAQLEREWGVRWN